MQPIFMLALGLALTGAPKVIESMPTPLTEAQIIEKELKGYPLLKEICRCESGLKQHYEDGSLVVGIKTPTDRGVCQISLPHHKDKLSEMKLNPDILEDNLTYAKFLYDNNGTKDWQASKHCWSEALLK